MVVRIKCTNVHKTASHHARHKNSMNGNLKVALNVYGLNNLEVIPYFVKCHFLWSSRSGVEERNEEGNI